MVWIMLAIVSLCIVCAAGAKAEARYWKDRCERTEAGFADQDVIRILDSHKRHGRVPGPAVRLFVGRCGKGLSA